MVSDQPELVSDFMAMLDTDPQARPDNAARWVGLFRSTVTSVVDAERRGRSATTTPHPPVAANQPLTAPDQASQHPTGMRTAAVVNRPDRDAPG